MAKPSALPAVPTLATADLRPYASFGVLEFIGPDPSKAVALVVDRLGKACLNRSGSPNLLAQGLADGWAAAVSNASGRTVSGDAFVYTYSRVPPWATATSPFTETIVDLVVVLRWDRLVAVSCPNDRVQSLQSWLDDTGKSTFRRITPLVLEHALLSGEAKGLWLRGVHARQKRKPDAKNIVGTDVRETLDPLGDGSFALTAGRAAAPDDARLIHTTGTLGVSPKKSWVWNRQTQTFEEFTNIALELMELVADEMKSPHSESAFPDLAVSVDSLELVDGAYDAYFADPEDVAMLPDTTDERIAHAHTLRGCVIEVTPKQKAKLEVTVGQNGSEVGRLHCSPTLEDGHVTWSFRVAGTPSDEMRTAEIRNAAEESQILNVFYESGHSINFDAASLRRVSHMPFRWWSFEDFTGFAVHREKPTAGSSQDIHNTIATAGDTSIFAWIVRRYNTGHLACDDGTNEVADFIHLGTDGTLTLIHAKAADADGPRRRCAAGPFELVASQAEKNARYLNVDELLDRLRSPSIAKPATWHNGKRVADRSKIIVALEKRSIATDARVVIVQPHHREKAHEAARKAILRSSPTQDSRRLMLIETLLNSARGAIAGQGADLLVYASR